MDPMFVLGDEDEDAFVEDVAQEDAADEDDAFVDQGFNDGAGIAHLVRRLGVLAQVFEIEIGASDMEYEDADPLARSVRVFRKIVGSDNEWIENGEHAMRSMQDFFAEIWEVCEEITTACNGIEHVPLEHKRLIERMFETLYISREMLQHMRRMAMLRAPESTFLEQNRDIRTSVEEQARGNGNRRTGSRHAQFQLQAACWDCACAASFGVGADEEDNTNPFRDRPIGLDDETVAQLGKHVRWTWSPPTVAPKDLKPFQQFVIALLAQARSRGYRRHKSGIYERVVTSGGRYTPAWRKVCGIEKFVRGDIIDRGLNFDNWRNATIEKGNLKAAEEYLTNCTDPSLPDLVKSRRLFAFTNGVYVTYIRHNGRVMDYFWSYNDNTGIPIAGASRLAANKYFERPCRYEHYSDSFWFEIPTPAMTSIMDYQQLPADVQKWHWVLLGRLLHAVGELDRWQICFFLRGVAQSGKSTIILFWKSFFEAEDMGTIANNMERTFGWGVLAEALICLGPELRADFVKNVDQATLQSIISGEIVSLPRKFMDPWKGVWRSPLFLVGNDELVFQDSSGQIARRIASIEYMHRVTSVDTSLESKLELEQDLILIKANRAYLAAVNEVGTGELWGKLPAYFKRIQANSFEMNNSFAHFIARCSTLVFGPDKYMPHNAFMKLYAAHAHTFGLSKLNWNRTNYLTTFGQKNITVSDRAEEREWKGATHHGTFIIGMDTIETDI